MKSTQFALVAVLLPVCLALSAKDTDEKKQTKRLLRSKLNSIEKEEEEFWNRELQSSRRLVKNINIAEDQEFWNRELQSSRRLVKNTNKADRGLSEGESLFWKHQLNGNSNTEDSAFWERELQSSRRLF